MALHPRSKPSQQVTSIVGRRLDAKKLARRIEQTKGNLSVRDCTIEGPLCLLGMQLEGPLRFYKCHFKDTVDFRDLNIKSSLGVEECNIDGVISLDDSRIEGSLFMRRTCVHAKPQLPQNVRPSWTLRPVARCAAVEFDRSKITGDAKLDGLRVRWSGRSHSRPERFDGDSHFDLAALSCKNATVGGSLDLGFAAPPTKPAPGKREPRFYATILDGYFDATGLKCEGDVVLSGASFSGDVRLAFSTIGGAIHARPLVDIDSELDGWVYVGGSFRLSPAAVAGPLYMHAIEIRRTLTLGQATIGGLHLNPAILHGIGRDSQRLDGNVVLRQACVGGVKAGSLDCKGHLSLTGLQIGQFPQTDGEGIQHYGRLDFNGSKIARNLQLWEDIFEEHVIRRYNVHRARQGLDRDNAIVQCMEDVDHRKAVLVDVAGKEVPYSRLTVGARVLYDVKLSRTKVEGELNFSRLYCPAVPKHLQGTLRPPGRLFGWVRIRDAMVIGDIRCSVEALGMSKDEIDRRVLEKARIARLSLDSTECTSDIFLDGLDISREFAEAVVEADGFVPRLSTTPKVGHLSLRRTNVHGRLVFIDQEPPPFAQHATMTLAERSCATLTGSIDATGLETKRLHISGFNFAGNQEVDKRVEHFFGGEKEPALKPKQPFNRKLLTRRQAIPLRQLLSPHDPESLASRKRALVLARRSHYSLQQVFTAMLLMVKDIYNSALRLSTGRHAQPVELAIWQTIRSRHAILASPNRDKPVPVVRLRLNQAKMRFLQVYPPYPDCVDFRTAEVSSWEPYPTNDRTGIGVNDAENPRFKIQQDMLGSAQDRPVSTIEGEELGEAFVALLGCSYPFARDTYRSVERQMRNAGDGAAADRVYRAMMDRDLATEPRAWPTLFQTLYKLLTAYGTYPTIWMAGLLIGLFLATTTIFMIPGNLGPAWQARGEPGHVVYREAILGEDLERLRQLRDMQSRIFVGPRTEQDLQDLHDLRLHRSAPQKATVRDVDGIALMPDAIANTIRFHVPLADLGVVPDLGPSSAFARGWARFVRLVHWILLPLLLVPIIVRWQRRRDL